MRNLDELRALEPGWDSYRAPAISEAALATAAAIEYVPMFSGGIQIELHVGDVELEAEIAPDGRVQGVLVSYER